MSDVDFCYVCVKKRKRVGILFEMEVVHHCVCKVLCGESCEQDVCV